MAEDKSVISVSEFRKLMDENKIEFIFDLRNPDEFEAWRIEGPGEEIETINLPQLDFVGEEEKYLDRLPKDKRILTVCAHGDASKYSAEYLQKAGFRAVGLDGGMDAWSDFYEIMPVPAEIDIYQIYRSAKGCISHVLVSGNEAVVIDAVRHIDQIMDIVDSHDARITHVFDTHLQADHISGGRDLAKRAKAQYYISPVDAHGATYPFNPFTDGLIFKFGKSTLEAIHTPGHTPGSTSLLLNKKYLFTGDTIMKTSIGRPDLGGMVKEWEGLLYDTLFNKLKGLPDEVLVLPTHAASLKEKDARGVVSLTLGQARADLDLFQLADRKAFDAKVEASLLDNPERYQEIRRVNLGQLAADDAKLKELEIGKNLCGMAAKK